MSQLDPSPTLDWQALTRHTVATIARRARAKFAPPSKIGITEWANRHRYLAAESADLSGKYSTDLTPWVPGIHAALDDSSIWKVVCMKSAQIAWTDGVINNWLGRIIDVDPSPVIGLFAKADAAREYGAEKFAPMVTATPRLSGKVDVRTSRKDGNRALFKKFPGGFLKLVGSNSPSNVKSTPSPRVFVEEPDDASINVGKQGDSIKLLEERTKTYARRKVVFGGTPSVKGISTIEDAYLTGDQRRFHVPCPDCGEAHVLSWDNIKWIIDPAVSHPVYGHSKPETAVYACPHCGAAWDDAAKNRAVRHGRWVAERECRGVASFHINELYSPFPGSRLERLVERYLEAQVKLEQGDETDMIVFVNSCQGLPYEYQSDAPALDALMERAEDYAENTVPAGGLILTAGVDVQHDRLAIVIRAWGRDEESWLVYWGEIYGTTVDKADPVWSGLEKLLFEPRRHASGAPLVVSAVSIDSGDGTTSDAVYQFVRLMARKGRNVMATKGPSTDFGQLEIFAKPKASVDTKGQRNTKAAQYGLRVYPVGTNKAKDLLAGRLKLTGDGAGRLHWYSDVRADYWKQITSEVKAPHRSLRGKKVWQKKAGQANEAWDCEVLALHAARSRKVHLLKPDQWAAIERSIAQAPLFADSELPAAPPPPESPRPAPPPPIAPVPPPSIRRQTVTRRVSL
ncbi:MAG: phage terminase large subunit family protein [Accumulibacter sp.]|uniref:phage terminase large subunit family protein n=1 Tax=Accumulibacter sp. TaxID=2053492 RepID=UPI003315D18E